MKLGWFMGLTILCGCSHKPSAEQIADLAATNAHWEEAYQSLRESGDEPRILGKRAEAGLQSGKIAQAIHDWERLARYDSTRSGEAAAGLARAASAAERSSDQLALADALAALRRIAPEWPVGRLAQALRLPSGMPSAEALTLAPAVLAAAPSRDVADDALYALGRAQQADHRCDRAEPVLRVVLGRADTSLAIHAGRALADCRLAAGLMALLGGDTSAAVGALNAAVDYDPDGPAGRRALVAIGDVQVERGQIFAAQLSWQTVATSRAAQDSITDMALERLQAQTPTDATGVVESP